MPYSRTPSLNRKTFVGDPITAFPLHSSITVYNNDHTLNDTAGECTMVTVLTKNSWASLTMSLTPPEAARLISDLEAAMTRALVHYVDPPA